MPSNNGFRQPGILYFTSAAEAANHDHQLAHAGYVVDRAITPARVLLLAESRPYSCLLLGGAILPALRKELTRAVRRENPNSLVVVLCSAPVDADECERAIFGAHGTAGADGLPDAILPADVPEQQLAAVLLQLLISSGARRKMRELTAADFRPPRQRSTTSPRLEPSAGF